MKKLICVTFALTMLACTKYKDTSPPDISGQLTRHYCNVPTAINYNDSFPGIADSSVCVYATDRFVGSWQIIDSIFRADNSLLEVQLKTIVISAPSDTSRQIVRLTGWCPDLSFPLQLRASRFSSAYFTNTTPNDSGQAVCSLSDTITGSMLILPNADTILKINAQVRTPLGQLRHQAIGAKL